MKILIIGANGFLGKKAFKILNKEYKVIGTSKKQLGHFQKLDLTKKEEVEEFINKHNPDLIFNCAVQIDLDICEKEKINSWEINTNGPLYLSDICKKRNIKLICVSSDYIFSGKESLYYENSIPDPISFYGVTKRAMEELVSYVNPDAIIIRPSILYGFNENDCDKLVMPILNALKSNKEIIINDFRPKYPVLTDDFVKNAIFLAENNYKGIFNFATKEPTNRYEMAKTVAKIFNLDEKLIKKGEAIKDFKNRPYEVKLINSRAHPLKFNSFEEGVRIIKMQMERK